MKKIVFILVFILLIPFLAHAEEWLWVTPNLVLRGNEDVAFCNKHQQICISGVIRNTGKKVVWVAEIEYDFCDETGAIVKKYSAFITFLNPRQLWRYTIRADRSILDLIPCDIHVKETTP